MSPRKDPMTGVPVLSLTEFFQREAEHEGKDVAEVFEDFFRQLDEANESDSQQLRLHALSVFQAEITNANEYSQPYAYNFDIVAVEKVESAESNSSLRESYEHLEAIVWLDTGRRCRAIYSNNQCAGTMWEPPDDESWIELEEIDAA